VSVTGLTAAFSHRAYIHLMQRLPLINYDVLRELCDSCRKERFHFVPSGAHPATGPCRNCGDESKIAEMTKSAVWRLIDTNGDVVIVPVISKIG
jgi:hypothetical protein